MSSARLTDRQGVWSFIDQSRLVGSQRETDQKINGKRLTDTLWSEMRASFFNFLLLCLLMTSCRCSFSLSSCMQNACNSSSCSCISFEILSSLSSRAFKPLRWFLGHNASPFAPQFQHTAWSRVSPFSCSPNTGLCLPSCPWLLHRCALHALRCVRFAPRRHLSFQRGCPFAAIPRSIGLLVSVTRRFALEA